MITIFADKYLYEIASFLPDEVDLHFYDPEAGLPNELDSAEALLIRTVTKINRNTWKQVPGKLQFVGTGSSGTDHVDEPFLKQHGIAFADAAGCNARSVAEYVAVSLMLWSDRFEFDLQEKRVGIVGAGHVGTQVDRLLKKLEIQTVLYDPPRSERDHHFRSAGLDEVLTADILSFHAPLTQKGRYPTFHWLDSNKLASAHFDLVINTARGGVIDENALVKAFDTNSVQNFVLDVWEQEPVFDDTVAEKAWIKTPHIAGYSKQAKLRASKLIAEALCQHFGFPISESGRDIPPSEKSGPFSYKRQLPELPDLLNQLHPVRSYEKEFKKLIGLPPKEKSLRFNKLRAEFPLRDEFGYLSVPKTYVKNHPILSKLGFNPA